MHTPKETNDKIKTNRNTFPFVSNVDVEESMFFYAELNIHYLQFLIFCRFMNSFLTLIKLGFLKLFFSLFEDELIQYQFTFIQLLNNLSKIG